MSMNNYAIINEKQFRKLAKTAVMNYWNGNEELCKRFGDIIGPDDVYIVWQVKVIQNFKALLGVNRQGDDMYFEFTYHGEMNCCYLDAYKKQDQVVIDVK